ncbi:hypothetical protein R3P38DRAFT_2970000 [Favolaschia claudopus]|uniref:RING-type domain-containing protein n=1 Tax=Favolaschia claudopus TaxID=2862362 RepID=A0AAW0B5P3_9AGAR
MANNHIIEIASSPENSPPPRSQPLPMRGKGRALTPGPDTIILTDSDDEDNIMQSRDRNARAVAGPSRRKQTAPLRHHRKDASAGSLENLPAKRRPPKHAPLFLPSDEENQPPQFEPFDEEPIDVEKLPSPPPDPIPGFVERVLDVLPDALPEHVLGLVRQHYPQSGDQVAEVVLHALFEDPAYPKVDKKGKRKRVETEDDDDAQGNVRGHPKAKVDYGSKDRPYTGGIHYEQLAIDQLMIAFPLIPKPHIRRTLFDNNSLYAPTHLFFAEELRGGVLSYTPKTIPSKLPAKGKGRALQDAEFEKEREWINSGAHDVINEQQDMEEVLDGSENGIECGCCFTDYPFEKMIQCPDAHLFCSTCMVSYAENLLGGHDHKIICMDQSGCKLPFPDAQLQRFLTPKLLSLYERVKQTKEVEAAGIEGLEECPFCEYKCVIENDQEKLFACRNEECGAVSCRQCKKSDHLPKSCKEVEQDKNLDARHTIEEAMTRALMRNCPKCQKAFIKEMGCNKMTCPNCNSLSCYICRKLINGYDHFAQQPGQPIVAGSSKGGKCALWDAVEQRHADEVKEAREKALAEYRRDHPDLVDDEHLRVDLPVAPPAPAPIPAPQAVAFGYPLPAIPAYHVNVQGWVRAQMHQQHAALPPMPMYAPPPPVLPPVVHAPPQRRRAPRRKNAWR